MICYDSFWKRKAHLGPHCILDISMGCSLPTVLQNRKFAAISGYFINFEISKKLFLVGLVTFLTIWNNARIIHKAFGTSKKIYFKFGEIAVFRNFLIFYVIPKNFEAMFFEVRSCQVVNRFNSGASIISWNS